MKKILISAAFPLVLLLHLALKFMVAPVFPYQSSDAIALPAAQSAGAQPADLLKSAAWLGASLDQQDPAEVGYALFRP